MTRLQFNNTVLQLSRKLYLIAFRFLKNKEEAEDAVQEVFIKLWNRRDELEKYTSIEALATTTIKNHCIDQLRRRRLPVDSLEELEPWEDVADLGPGPEKSATLREAREAARALLGRLGPQDRAVVVLRYWDELSTEEIAEALSLTVKAVKSRLHRARKQMAEAWLRDNPEPAWSGGRADVASAV